MAAPIDPVRFAVRDRLAVAPRQARPCPTPNYILSHHSEVIQLGTAYALLGHVHKFTCSGHCTVLLITHKLRDVMAYANNVTVLRCSTAGLSSSSRAKALFAPPCCANCCGRPASRI